MYLDSAILVKLVVREPDSIFYFKLLDGARGLRSSELAVTECRSVLERKRQQGELDAATCDGAWRRLGSYWQRGGGLALHPVTRLVLDEAGARGLEDHGFDGFLKKPFTDGDLLARVDGLFELPNAKLNRPKLPRY